MTTLDPEGLGGVLELIDEMRGDWEYSGAIGPETFFILDLGLESLEIVVLATMLQQRYGRLPFPAFFEEIGQRPVQQRDLTVAELAEFVCRHRRPIHEEV